MRCFGKQEIAYLTEVIDSQELWRGAKGNFVYRFEQAFGKHLGRQYVLGVASGTCANETALAGLGLQPGDEVICPSTAPIFVSLPVVSIGCVPVFAEVDPRTLIISPEGIEERITEKTRAVVVVHLFGQPAPMDEILAVTRKHNLNVVEDCAQAFDCHYKGRKAGTLGDATCFSLQQSKHITSGEGGIVATDDAETYKRMVLFATAGMAWYQYDLDKPTAEPLAGLRTRGHYAFGHNYRMSELQGAVALAQLEKIDALSAQRQALVDIIEGELRDVAGVDLAFRYPDTRPNYWAYPLRVPERYSAYAEINYLEVVYQEMERTRQTSLGIPLPDYVHYCPGACPRSEVAAQRFRPMMVHPAAEPEAVGQAARELRDAIEKGA
ncbi:MAG: DegT/DnrJ/EryC1/StrS family aminotransferase [Armatimonadetes bacterium]|nr:DegT/DnrJ/EryC1/StrS family aminotransferase [Armatimonadota bacterium]PJB73517.1 MAG: hypothetical protein CO095_05765 [Armatimonadetes bacterium CG_4_9_14_3_um_filter_58_7]